ncbi:hypothetical protein ACFQ1I_32800 [Kitasatospora arboriphila]
MAEAASGGPGTPVVVEADPAGGDWHLGFGLPGEAGLVRLAAASRRRTLDLALLHEHAVRIPGGAVAVTAPEQPEQCAAALGALAPEWADAETGGTLVVADCGRLAGLAAGQKELLSAADLVLLVCRGAVGSLAHAATAADRLRTAGRPVVAVVVGDSAWSPGEIAETLGAAACRALPHDAESVALLHGAPLKRWRRWRRGPYTLMPEARGLALELSRMLPPPLAEAQKDTDTAPPVEADTGLAARLGRAT